MKTPGRLTMMILTAALGLYSSANWAFGHGGGHHGGFGGGGHHFGHSNFGLYFGAPFYGYPSYRYGFGYGFGYPYPYYYPPSVVTVPVAPPNYIQQPQPTVQQYPAGYWYYCQNPEGYYPYINECPGGWRQVSPAPNQ